MVLFIAIAIRDNRVVVVGNGHADPGGVNKICLDDVHSRKRILFTPEIVVKFYDLIADITVRLLPLHCRTGESGNMLRSFLDLSVATLYLTSLTFEVRTRLR